MNDPIDPKVREVMNGIGDLLGKQFKPHGCGFALLVFDFGDKGRMNYISNGTREDMIAAMKEFIARSEGSYHLGPAKVQ